MSQSVHGAHEAVYSYDASNASAYTGVSAESPVAAEFSLLHSRAVWAFSLLLAFLVARVFTQKKLPPGVKRLPKLPGKHWPT